MEAVSRAVPTGVRMARTREPLKPVLSPEVSLEDRQDLSLEVSQVTSLEVRQEHSSEAREDRSLEVRLSPEEARHISTSLSQDSVTSRASMASPCNLKKTSVLSSLFHPCQYNQNVLCQ